MPIKRKSFLLSENQYRQLVDLSPEAIAVHSEGVVVYANKAGASLICAKSPNALLGQPITKFIHPDFWEIAQKRIDHILKTGKRAELMEERFIRLDGEVLDVEVVSMPLLYSGKSSVVSIIRDITARKKTERRQEFLGEVSRTLFTSFKNTLTLQQVAQLIVPSLADYCRIVVLGKDGEISEISVNHKDPKKVTLASELYESYKNRADSIYGVQKILTSGKAEMISKVSENVLHKFHTNPKISEIVRKIGLKSYAGVPLIARKKVIGVITFSSVQPNRFYKKDDLEFFIEVGKRIALALDNARLYKEAQEEIEIRKQIELNLKFLAEASRVLSSSLDYQTTLNSVAKLAVPEIADWCGVDILDEKGEVQQVAIAHKDPQKVKWAKEFRKKRPVNMSSPTGLPHILKTGKSEMYQYVTDEMLKATARNKETMRIIKKIGLRSVMLVPLFSGGKPIGGITFVNSKIWRRFNESDLSMAEELASRASLAIENAKLYKSSQDAIALRNDFISVASHELKTPVTSVKIFTQVLEQHSKQIGDQKAVDYLQKMDKQINKLTDLIYNLLNISRIQAGRLEYKKRRFDFDKMISEVVDVLQQNTKHKLIIEGRTGEKIKGDEDRLGQVLSNIVSNAIKYSPDADKVLIKLSKGMGKVTVAVVDFGIGIEQGHLNKIFERFYRVYDTEDKTFPGLGLGLYISSEIINRHNGKLWVESDAGKGSIFYFSLPVQGS